MSQGPDLLTVPDVMERMQISRHAVYRLIRTRALASVTIGRSRRIPTAALTDFLSDLTETGTR